MLSLLAAGTCCLIYIISNLLNLYKNYVQARETGLSIVIVPLNPYNFSWHFISRLFGPILKHFQWCRVLDQTWSWEDNDKHHARLGDSFMLVSPGQNILCTRDKAAIESVVARRKEFVKPAMYQHLNIFGKNVNTVNGEDWARHRKLTASCFNERVSSFVWDESVRQAQAMTTHWLAQHKGKISRMVDDTRIIALHVLYAAGFGVSHDFLGGARLPAPGYRLSHRDAIMTILNNIITSIILAPMVGLLERIQMVLSPRLRNILLALKEYRRYMDEMVASERRIMAKGKGVSKPNLISALIHTSDQAKAEGIHSTVRLTDDEIKGNIFMFNFAGHDTTANTLAYAFALLAVHPDIQDWVTEEVDEVLSKEGTRKYEQVFPRLKRVMAIMNETLRLYGPVPHIPRGVVARNTPLVLTNPHPASTSPSTVLIQPGIEVHLKLHAMHTTPSTFPDPTSWDPTRWITPSTSTSSSIASILEGEKLIQMDHGFAPWSSGPRICPGMKFAQVEFVGVLSTVLDMVKIAPSVKGDVDVDEAVARKTVTDLVRDSTMAGPTLTLRRPGDVWIKVSKR